MLDNLYDMAIAGDGLCGFAAAGLDDERIKELAWIATYGGAGMAWS